MKRIAYVLFFILLTTCSKDNDPRERNPYLPDYSFDTGSQINLTLPQYNDLNFPGGSLEIYGNGIGINGFVIFNYGNGSFRAFELTDPNHALDDCSVLAVDDNDNAYCNCDDGNSYLIANGLPQEGTDGQYPLLEYFVEVNGNIIRVYNQ